MSKNNPPSTGEEHLVEADLPAETKEVLLSLGLEIGRSGYVLWRKDNPSHPRNWRGARKAFDIGLVVIFDLVACVSQCAGIGRIQLMSEPIRTVISTAGVS